MQVGAITEYIDVAQVTLYVFFLFFFGLVIYLRKEDKREGYPLVTDRPGEVVLAWPEPPSPKMFLMPDGSVKYAPSPEPEQPTFEATRTASWDGSPLLPTGNPLLSGVGPNASALRSDKPDMMNTVAEVRIIPMRLAPDYVVDENGPDPRKMRVVAANGLEVGEVVDLWFDRAEDMVRYMEVTLDAGGNVLVPAPLIQVNDSAGQIIVQSIMSRQFADAPRLASPDQVTLREEDRIQAYFASGHLYATPSRSEPLI